VYGSNLGEGRRELWYGLISTHSDTTPKVLHNKAQRRGQNTKAIQVPDWGSTTTCSLIVEPLRGTNADGFQTHGALRDLGL
jgi:hypothetical protein